jgi:hypothetical protein
VHERVSAEISLTGPDNQDLQTGTPYTFSGTVSPPHTGERVLLQRSAGDDRWHTIDRARIGAGGAYTIVHRFAVPGDAGLRVAFPGDRRNSASASTELSDTVSQKQNPDLTLNSSADPISEGGSTDLSGTLAGVSAPTLVTLYSHVHQRNWAPVATTQTDASGNYTFAGQMPVFSTFYQVRGAGKASAVLYEGVHDVVTATASATTVNAGDSVTFSGSVAPDKTGHVIVLERRNANGNGWHVVERARIATGSTFSIVHRVAEPGTKTFRVRIPGGPQNLAGVSGPFTITVNPAAAM